MVITPSIDWSPHDRTSHGGKVKRIDESSRACGARAAAGQRIERHTPLDAGRDMTHEDAARKTGKGKQKWV
jgi:hypothetical protein